jgi:hypothetical protein
MQALSRFVSVKELGYRLIIDFDKGEGAQRFLYSIYTYQLVVYLRCNV